MTRPDTPITRTAAELHQFMVESPDMCCVCRFTDVYLRRAVDALFYESVNDYDTRHRIREAGGFCRHHSRLVHEQADALGSAIILEDLIKNRLRALEGSRSRTPARGVGGLAMLFRTNGSVRHEACPLCRQEREGAELGVDSLLRALTQPEVASTFSQSTGLCLLHFDLAQQRPHGEQVWQLLVETETRALSTLQRQLAELARKHDYRFQREAITAEEKSSWQRALDLTAGWPDDVF